MVIFISALLHQIILVMYLNIFMFVVVSMYIFFNIKFKPVHYIKQACFINVSIHNTKIEGICRMANINSAKMKKKCNFIDF